MVVTLNFISLVSFNPATKRAYLCIGPPISRLGPSEGFRSNTIGGTMPKVPRLDNFSAQEREGTSLKFPVGSVAGDKEV